MVVVIAAYLRRHSRARISVADGLPVSAPEVLPLKGAVFVNLQIPNFSRAQVLAYPSP